MDTALPRLGYFWQLDVSKNIYSSAGKVTVYPCSDRDYQVGSLPDILYLLFFLTRLPISVYFVMTISRTFLVLSIWLFLFSIDAPNCLAQQEQSPPAKHSMSIGQAAILGIVEGVTEYLPVSSTGHLLLAERILGIGDAPSLSSAQKEKTKDASDAYAICIQAGAIAAVLGLYFHRITQMISGLLGKSPQGRKLVINLLTDFFPAAVIALAFNSKIKALLFGPWPVVFAWFIGGVAILYFHAKSKQRPTLRRSSLSIDRIDWQMALVIGLFQCVAMWPGVSRSLVTIAGGLLVGMSMSAAVEFSFLLGVVTLGSATAYDALKHGKVMLETFDAIPLAVGVLFAFFSAVLAIRWMVSYLNRHGMAIFGYYRIALSIIVGGLLLAKVF